MNHCSEERLLALLDGELPAAERSRVMRHVDECWRCRTALRTLEGDIANVVRRFREAEASLPPDPAVLARIVATCRPARPRPVPRWRFAFVAALLVAFVLVWNRSPQPPLVQEPRSAVQEAVRRELALDPGARVASQSLTVTIGETRPARRTRQLRLRVWTDLARPRSAVHLDGRVVLAAYRPGPAMADSVIASDTVEEGLMRWLESRAPQPLSLARILIDFADAHGLPISWEGHWLVAGRMDGTRRIALRLQLGADGRPQVSAIRLDAADRAWELTLRADSPTAYLKDPVSDSLFAPPVLAARVEPQPAGPFPDPVDLEAAELEARYALHRAGLDRGQFDYVASDRELVVRAPAAPDGDREAWSRALAGRPHTRLEVPQNPEAPAAETVVPALRSSAEPPLEDLVRRHFLEQPGDARQRGERMAAWLNEVVGLSQEAMRAAWGIRRLAARYGQTDLARLRAEQRWLIEAMLLDLLDDLDRAVDAQNARLAPVLGPPVTPSPATLPPRWDGLCESAFSTTQRTQDLLLALLTGAGALDAPTEESAARIREAMGGWSSLRESVQLAVKTQFGTLQEEP